MVYEMAKKWRIDEGIKIFGCQNSENSALYNGEGNLKNIWLKNEKSPLYIVVEGDFENFFEKGGKNA